MGRDIQNTSTPQALSEIRSIRVKIANSRSIDDDGITYGYEKGQGRMTRLHWDDGRQQLTATGTPLSGAPIAKLTKVIR